MPRQQCDAKKALRFAPYALRTKEKKNELLDFIPGIGFDFTNKRCRAMLSGVDSAIIKESIRTYAGKLDGKVVDEALATIFEHAIAAMEEKPEMMADMMPGEYWGIMKQKTACAGDEISSHSVFTLAVALIICHDKYTAVFPYEESKHQYGKLAEAVHKFSELLKKHQKDHPIIMTFYFESTYSLPSDDEDDEETEMKEKKPTIEKAPKIKIPSRKRVAWNAPAGDNAEDLRMVDACDAGCDCHSLEKASE